MFKQRNTEEIDVKYVCKSITVFKSWIFSSYVENINLMFILGRIVFKE